MNQQQFLLTFQDAKQTLPEDGTDWLLVRVRPESHGGYVERDYYTLAVYDHHIECWRTKVGAIGIKHKVVEWAFLPELES